jgi:MFS family permease
VSAAARHGGSAWWRELSRYHWWVLGITSLAWMFDCMGQQFFALGRQPAITELLGAHAGDAAAGRMVAEYAGYATSAFMVGWAGGGVVFGILGDRLGRVKTMMLTVLFYSLFTGLSALSVGVVDFLIYRVITGFGVGGMFAAGVALVAETMPVNARPFALGWLQAFSSIGNMIAAIIGIALGGLQQAGEVTSAWRWMFVIGALPAFLCLWIMRRLKEPEQWQKAAQSRTKLGIRLGSMGELFSDARWRRNCIVGLLLAFSGVVGLWGIGYFSYDLLRTVFDKTSLTAGQKTLWIGIASLLQNFGGFFGVYAFTQVTARIGRRRAFAYSFLAALLVTAFTFAYLRRFSDIFWMIPAMGFTHMTLFGGYSIYLPELFPTRLRSTGTSFCYNGGRLVAAVGPLALGLLTSRVFAHEAEPMRWAGVSMSLVFLVGLATLPFAPETLGQPLPE